MTKREKPKDLTEVVVQFVTLEVGFDWHPAEPTTGIPEEYEITEVWVGDQDFTDTTMAESAHEEIIDFLSKKRRMYQDQLDRIDRCAGSYRGFWPREVN